MRENVIRDIVTRLMTDASFRDMVVKTPGALFGEYNLETDERDALFNMEIEGLPLKRLEQRLSASFGGSLLKGDDDDNCGCCPVKHPNCYTPERCGGGGAVTR